MSVPSALNFLKQYEAHKSASQETLNKLNDTYLHERVYITLSCPETFKRLKTAGVITSIECTLSNYFRFTIVTEQGRELIVRHDIITDKALVQGELMDVKIDVL